MKKAILVDRFKVDPPIHLGADDEVEVTMEVGDGKIKIIKVEEKECKECPFDEGEVLFDDIHICFGKLKKMSVHLGFVNDHCLCFFNVNEDGTEWVNMARLAVNKGDMINLAWIFERIAKIVWDEF